MSTPSIENDAPYWPRGICPHPAPTNLCRTCEDERRAAFRSRVCEDCRAPWHPVVMPLAGGYGCRRCGNRTYVFPPGVDG